MIAKYLVTCDSTTEDDNCVVAIRY